MRIINAEIMEKQTCAIVICLLLGGCTANQYQDTRKNDMNHMGGIIKSLENMSSTHMDMINNGSPLSEVTNKTKEAEWANQEFDEICKRYQNKSHIDFKLHSTCSDIYASLERVRAKMMLLDGKYATKVGQKEEAKRIFRIIITTFTETANKPYTEQAAFELKNLK